MSSCPFRKRLSLKPLYLLAVVTLLSLVVVNAQDDGMIGMMESGPEEEVIILMMTDTMAPSNYTMDSMNMTMMNMTTMNPTEEVTQEEIPEEEATTVAPTVAPTTLPPTVAPTTLPPTTPKPVSMVQVSISLPPPTSTPPPTTPAPTNTDHPSQSPSVSPSHEPSASPTSSTRDCDATPVTNDEILTIRSAIEDVIDGSGTNFRAKFVRLSFHDCIGGCDGCIDMSDPENAGLEEPIEGLEDIVADFENECISRADIWALAGLVGADMAQDQEDFPMIWVGRENCDADNPMEGPAENMPHAQMDIHSLLDYFSGEFGFNAQQVVALMGAHSIGRVEEDNSGFVGRGWDAGVEEMDNGYYEQLVGDDNGVTDAPPWRQVQEEHFQWAGGQGNGGGGGGAGEDRLIMLNVDIALVRDFSNDMNTNTGEVDCRFNNRGNNNNNNNGGLCPVATETFSFMEEYRNSNSAFLSDFADVFDEMLVNGYDASDGCDDEPCRLPSRRRNKRRRAEQDDGRKGRTLLRGL